MGQYHARHEADRLENQIGRAVRRIGDKAVNAAKYGDNFSANWLVPGGVLRDQEKRDRIIAALKERGIDIEFYDVFGNGDPLGEDYFHRAIRVVGRPVTVPPAGRHRKIS